MRYDVGVFDPETALSTWCSATSITAWDQRLDAIFVLVIRHARPVLALAVLMCLNSYGNRWDRISRMRRRGASDHQRRPNT